MLAFYNACIFAEPAKMLHHADYKDDMADDIVWYGMHVQLHGLSQVSYVKVYRFPCIQHGRSQSRGVSHQQQQQAIAIFQACFITC